METIEVDELIKKIPEIAKAVNSFNSEKVQVKAFEFLANAINPAAQTPKSNFASTETMPLEGSAPKTRSRRSGSSKSKRTEGSHSTAFDAGGLANRIKEREDFDILNNKFIISNANRKDRAKFILWSVDDKTGLSSGDLSRVLIELGVNMNASQASKAFGDIKLECLVDSNATPKTYRLTAAARTKFEATIRN